MKINEKIKTILITGGSGFLGKFIVREFLDLDSGFTPVEIRILDLKPWNDSTNEKIKYINGDIRDERLVSEACRGVDLVIHTAAIVDWGTHSEKEVYDVNVRGTEHVISGCREQKVPYLIFTSSLDAVYSGRPLVDINEDQPYPGKHPNMYCRSKFLAEQAIIRANGPDLRTSILRPSDIYGEGDPYHIDSLINMARGGFYVRLGNGRARCQHVYVGNMAWAHVLLARKITEKKCNVCGKIYFITDGPGRNFFTFFDQVVTGAGYKIWPKNLWIPKNPAFLIGGISEFLAFLMRPFRHYNPKFSRFAVLYTCNDFTFSGEKAKREIGYIPKYNEEESLKRTIQYYRDRKN